MQPYAESTPSERKRNSSAWKKRWPLRFTGRDNLRTCRAAFSPQLPAEIQNEIDALASSISSASSEPRSSTKLDRIDAMVGSDDENGDEHRDGPATPDLIDEPASLEYLSMHNLVHMPTDPMSIRGYSRGLGGALPTLGRIGRRG